MSYEVPPKLLSWDDALRLYPDTPVEIIDGVVVAREAAPFTPHQRVVGKMFRALGNYLEAHPGVGEAFVSPYDVKLRIEAPAIVVQPDVLFVRAARAHLIAECLNGAPDIAIEVVSPSSQRNDLILKRDRYARYGVTEYWVLWPDEHQIDVLRLDGRQYTEAEPLGREDTLTSPLLPGFSVTVGTLF